MTGRSITGTQEHTIAMIFATTASKRTHGQHKKNQDFNTYSSAKDISKRDGFSPTTSNEST